MPWSEYLTKAKAVGNGWEFWLEKDLFNRLRLEDYLEPFRNYFEVKTLLVIGSPEAKRFKRTHPADWDQLRSQHSESDLMVRLVSLTGTRK